LAGSTHNSSRVVGIILAAGTGSRMGRTKQLLPFKGRPLLTHTIEQGLSAGLAPLILVLGHRADKIQARLSPFSLDLVINKDYQSGMSSSIRAGLERLNHLKGNPFRGALFLLGDQPLVNSETIQTILTEAGKFPGKIIIPTFRGRRGNPVYFDQCFFDPLRQLSGDTGGRDLFRQFPRAIHKLPVNTPGICLDVDTPKDYERLCQRTKEEA